MPNISNWYRRNYIIADDNCLKLAADGSLSLSSSGLIFSKVFSAKRLLPQYNEELISDCNIYVKQLLTKKHKTTKRIVKYILNEVLVTSLQTLTDTYATHLSNMLTSQLHALFAEIFSENTAHNLLYQLTHQLDLKIENHLLIWLTKNNHLFKQALSTLIYTHLDLSIAINQRQIKQTILTLQEKQTLSEEYSAVEPSIIDHLEKSLHANEIALLEAKKISIVTTAQKLFANHECRGRFVHESATIYLNTDNIAASLIHEVQHSLGFDIRPSQWMNFFKFYKQCMDSRLSPSQGLVFKLTDRKQVKAYTKIHTSEVEVKMINRARYLLSLYNYDVHQRTRELLAHLRQFIVDFGAEKTKAILPKLYHFWEKEILGHSIERAANQLEICRKNQY